MTAYFNFTHCCVCGERVDEAHEHVARMNIADAICGPECYHKRELKRFACCDKAVPTMCVCHYSTMCPDHGKRCHGTHD